MLPTPARWPAWLRDGLAVGEILADMVIRYSLGFWVPINAACLETDVVYVVSLPLAVE
jgi:hypothetical protein